MSELTQEEFDAELELLARDLWERLRGSAPTAPTASPPSLKGVGR